jgi:hypothetical protein
MMKRATKELSKAQLQYYDKASGKLDAVNTLLSCSICICRGWRPLQPLNKYYYIHQVSYLHLVEHRVGLHVGRVLGAAQNQAPDGRLHEQLLEDGVHVAGRAAVADAHVAAGVAAQLRRAL